MLMPPACPSGNCWCTRTTAEKSSIKWLHYGERKWWHYYSVEYHSGYGSVNTQPITCAHAYHVRTRVYIY